jgi:hypothetical protein
MQGVIQLRQCNPLRRLWPTRRCELRSMCSRCRLIHDYVITAAVSGEYCLRYGNPQNFRTQTVTHGDNKTVRCARSYNHPTLTTAVERRTHLARAVAVRPRAVH